jgi:hypothetical protein
MDKKSTVSVKNPFRGLAVFLHKAHVCLKVNSDKHAKLINLK